MVVWTAKEIQPLYCVSALLKYGKPQRNLEVFEHRETTSQGMHGMRQTEASWKRLDRYTQGPSYTHNLSIQ